MTMGQRASQATDSPEESERQTTFTAFPKVLWQKE